MCNPIAIMAATTLVTGGLQAAQSYQQGKYTQGVQNYNARVAYNTAQDTRNAANEAENIQRRETAELIARQRARLGAANVDINSGSALQLQDDARIFGEVDALRIRKSGTDQFNSLINQSSLLTSQGNAAATAGRNAAVGSLLTTAGNFMGSGVADSWFKPNSAAKVAASNNKRWQDGGDFAGAIS